MKRLILLSLALSMAFAVNAPKTYAEEALTTVMKNSMLGDYAYSGSYEQSGVDTGMKYTLKGTMSGMNKNRVYEERGNFTVTTSTLEKDAWSTPFMDGNFDVGYESYYAQNTGDVYFNVNRFNFSSSDAATEKYGVIWNELAKIFTDRHYKMNMKDVMSWVGDLAGGYDVKEILTKVSDKLIGHEEAAMIELLEIGLKNGILVSSLEGERHTLMAGKKITLAQTKSLMTDIADFVSTYAPDFGVTLKADIESNANSFMRSTNKALDEFNSTMNMTLEVNTRVGKISSIEIRMNSKDIDAPFTLSGSGSMSYSSVRDVTLPTSNIVDVGKVMKAFAEIAEEENKRWQQNYGNSYGNYEGGTTWENEVPTYSADYDREMKLQKLKDMRKNRIERKYSR